MKTLQRISALVMVAVMLLTGLPVMAASVTPTPYSGNPDCDDLGYDYEYRFDPPNTGTVNLGVYGILTMTKLDSYTIHWSSTGIVFAVLVKAANGGNRYDYSPNGSFGDTNLVSPGTRNAISHVSFCYNAPAIETGDAPDSTNHFGISMSAYGNPGVNAIQGNFPTVADSALGAPVGMCHYVAPNGAYLGAGRSAERDADLPVDADGITNLIPTSNVNDADSDDGLILPKTAWYNGVPTTITYIVSVPNGGVAGTRYVNVWFDWDRDGAWGGDADCGSARFTVKEHTLVNIPVVMGAGPSSVEIVATIIPCNNPNLTDRPAFSGIPVNQIATWVRITLSEKPVVLPAQANGSGAGCYAEGETEDYFFNPVAPSAVELARFEAAAQEEGIVLEWETATEIDNLGFNLYRSTAADGAYVQLNAELIPTQNPGAVFGGVYTWLDEDVIPGVTYFYKLEDVDIEGVATLHGPVQATALATGPSAVRLTSFSAGGAGWTLPLALSALALLGGLKRRK